MVWWYQGLDGRNHALKQQLLVLRRKYPSPPKLTTKDRFFFGLCAFFIDPKRLEKLCVVLKPSTILSFHQALVKRKYSRLYSKNNKQRQSGRKPPEKKLVDLVLDIKRRNPTMGYGRIAHQIYEAFGISMSRYAVGRIIRNHKGKLPTGGGGPSWLTFIGHLKDSLWSVDLFRVESISLKSHWVMVVMDQYTRRIIGFAVQVGDCDGVAYCRMFNQIIAGKHLPKYLSTDNDPLFTCHRWQANLRIIEVEEIKSIPYVPNSHPFIERVIGTVRRECLDQQLFFNSVDLQRKLNAYQKYYNEKRIHTTLQKRTPHAMSKNSSDMKIPKNIVHIQWQSYSQGLYELPIAA